MNKLMKYFLFILCFSSTQLLATEEASKSEEKAQAFYSNATRVTGAGNYGKQISYTAANGQAYLWFPTNDSIVTGKWYIIKKIPKPFLGEHYKDPVVHICFNYPNSRNAWNPLKTSDECFRAGYSAKTMKFIEYTKGDKYGLSKSQSVPFVLPKGNMTLEEFKQLWKERAKR